MHEAADTKSLGEELVFLISQPRSGSTLLQHMLGSHRDILTLPEPWHMLHIVYANRSKGHTAEYNAEYAHIALQDFLERVDQGQTVYADATREFALHLYRAAMKGTGKALFLDKTPRYFFIIDELFSIFPGAKFIFLLRNPLSVFASILQNNFGGDWWQLIRQEDRRKDLLVAPNNILSGIKRLGQSAITVKYEDLVLEPAATMARICTHLEIENDPQMLEYGGKVKFEGTSFVDSKSIYKHATIVDNYLDAWKSTLDTKSKIALAKAYVNLLDDDVLSTYGEERGELNSKLAEQEQNIRVGRAVEKQELLERLLQHGDAFNSRWEQLYCELALRMRDQTVFSKFRWLAARLVKGD